jgi:hypothetical protein
MLFKNGLSITKLSDLNFVNKSFLNTGLLKTVKSKRIK